MHNALEQFNFNPLESWIFPAFSGFVALCAFFLFHASALPPTISGGRTVLNWASPQIFAALFPFPLSLVFCCTLSTFSLSLVFRCTFSFFTFSFLLQFLLFVFLEFWQHCGKAAAVQLKLFPDFCQSLIFFFSPNQLFWHNIHLFCLRNWFNLSFKTSALKVFHQMQKRPFVLEFLASTDNSPDWQKHPSSICIAPKIWSNFPNIWSNIPSGS